MTHWVAFLRAVNLGARNRVPMAQLRALLEERGHGSVRTYIASGNVLFETRSRSSARVARALEELIAEAFGVETTAILRTPAELAAVVAAHPFGADTSQTHVAFLEREPEPEAIERLREAGGGPDAARLAGLDVYLHLPAGVQGSRLSGARLERLLGVRGTARNWRTVEALAALATRSAAPPRPRRRRGARSEA